MVTSAIDALAHLITGSPRYFHAQGTLGEPGENRTGHVTGTRPIECGASYVRTGVAHPRCRWMEYAPQPPIITGIKGRCPVAAKATCSVRALSLRLRPSARFVASAMLLQIQPTVRRFFSMMVMAFPATGFALWLDMKYAPRRSRRSDNS